MNACKVLELISNGENEKLIKLAKAEIKEQSIKEKGGSTALKRFKAAQRYIKRMEKNCWRSDLLGTWEENGQQCFSDGYTAFLLTNKIDGLNKVENNLNLHKIVEKSLNDALQEISFNISDVKTALKIYRAENGRNCPVPCDFYLGISRYNAEYILNCYDILGGNIVFKQSKTNELAPAILESENGIAILLPMRKPERECA